MKIWLFFIGALLVSTSSFASPRYYVTVFSHQDGKNTARNSHTWATFVQANGDEVENVQTISWGPANGNVVLLHKPERGRNRSLNESLNSAFARGLHVSQWGPFEIREELFQRAARKVQELESGRILYKVLDKKFRPWVASNCFHAVADIDMDHGMVIFGTLHGDAASQLVVNHFSRWYYSNQTHPWLNEKLGLTNLPIYRR